MKRRARLDYSTSYLPMNQASGYKRFHREGEYQNEENNDQYNEQNIDENVENQEEMKIDKQENEYQGLRVKKPEVENENKEETVDEIISRKLSTNPLNLIKQGKENQYGNFRSYYDHRYDKKWSDPRLKVLERDWFLNKDVLDIGCNDGSFTLQLAIKYFPFKIMGIDIDFNLINKAVSNYILLEKQQAKCKNTSLTNEGEQDLQNQQDHYKKLRDKLSRLPKSFIVDKNKQSEKLEETYLIQNASNILSINEQSIQVEGENGQIVDNPKPVETQQNTQIIDQSNLDNQQEVIIETINKTEQNNNIIQNEIPPNSLLNSDDNNKQSNAVNTIEEKIEIQKNTDENIESQVQQIEDSVMAPPQKLYIKRKFPHNVQFRMENYVESTDLTEKYDTICCFSTTKWIHLNFGDQGIKRLFDKVFRSLRVNGIFILEPQEWRSYKKKQNFSEEFRSILKSIKLHPGEFKQYLLDNYKYVLEKEIAPELNSNKVPSFFKRVVYVFKKIE